MLSSDRTIGILAIRRGIDHGGKSSSVKKFICPLRREGGEIQVHATTGILKRPCLPFHEAWREVFNVNFLKKSHDLGAGQSALSVGRHLACSLQMLRIERLGSFHVLSFGLT